MDRYAAANDRRRPLQAAERDVVLGIEEPVNLSAARLKQRGHPVLRDFHFLHGVGELPCQDLLDGLCLRLIEYAFVFQEVVNTGTATLRTIQVSSPFSNSCKRNLIRLLSFNASTFTVARPTGESPSINGPLHWK